MKPARLDKLVSEAAGISRAQAKAFIAAGKVEVNGVPCRDAQAKFQNPALVIAGQAVQHNKYVYLMLNKPVGVESATKGRAQNVRDLVAQAYPRRALFPAGRLDKASEGFILMTDDGPLAHRILAPKSHLPKRYIVTLDTPFTSEMAQGFAEGVLLADGTLTQPASAQPMADAHLCTVILHEGKYHQIKRMFGVFGAGVNALKRVAIGPLELDETLAPGQFRPLTAGELQALVEAAAVSR
ncbi:rRNA pseudouridine synthase [Ruminococcaceae bacterium OttesenSCG-928-N02]|nr:rRNA pseudouridine synthase [Ruminococcaceae bacterium OttesenSCG-928-N02]